MGVPAFHFVAGVYCGIGGFAAKYSIAVNPGSAELLPKRNGNSKATKRGENMGRV